MSTDCPVIVMAKAPVPGQVKTRLAPALGADGAAALACCMLARSVEQALASELGPVVLCCAPDETHPAFQRMQGWPGLRLSCQGDGDIGARMERALARALDGTERALLIGTDVPGLDAAVLRQAAAALHSHDAVFVPALDGGYALVGLRRRAPTLFEGIAWSTAVVMQQTRERLAHAGLRHAELEPLADIDEPADLARLPAGWRA